MTLSSSKTVFAELLVNGQENVKHLVLLGFN